LSARLGQFLLNGSNVDIVVALADVVAAAVVVVVVLRQISFSKIKGVLLWFEH
jgi:hypothetical protein